MKVLVVCQYYYPENFQVTPICEQMVQDGYDVTVLTGLPNYPTGIVPEEYKTGKRDEYLHGVHVLRCNEIGRKQGAVSLAKNYMSFYFSAMKKVRSLKEQFDCVFVYQLSPVLMGLPARAYAKKHGVPMYLYCLDLWPESIKMYAKKESSPLFRWAKRVSKKVYDACDMISVQSESFLDYFMQEHQIPADKLCYIPAFADDTYLNKDFHMDNGVTDFVFMGNIGIAQNLDLVIEAFDRVRDYNCKLHIVGDGTCLSQIKKLVSEKNLQEKVVFYGRRPVEEMEKFYELADACLVTLSAENKTGLTLPAKVQGYMAAGKPIIGMIDGSAQKVIREANCGLCVDAGDVDGLAEAMEAFSREPERYADFGQNGREYFMKHFCKKDVVEKIEKVLTDLVNQQ